MKIFWTDETRLPLSASVILRMGDNNAEAYAQFAENLSKVLEPFRSVGGAEAATENPYALGCLLVSCETLPDLSAYKVEIIPGPDNLYVLRFHSPRDAQTCEQYLKTVPSVRYVEPDRVMLVDSDIKLLDASAAHSWGVAATEIGAYADSLAKQGNRNTVVVAVVDSGVDAGHPFLSGRLLPGFDYVQYDDDPNDENGHGTHVAGTVVDCSPGLNVKILPVRVLNAFGGGDWLHIALGVRYAADHGANIINLSLGGGGHSQTLEDAIQYALSKNVTVVAAAGNHNGKVDTYCPAHMEPCITVAAVDENLKRFELSNYGNAVDLAAPGVEVESAVPGGGYDTMSGTSMATPHVSAAAALLMYERGTQQTPAQISRLLRDTASALTNDPGKSLGSGFLNLRPFMPTEPGFYALLYSDGEFVFQKGNTPNPDKTLLATYPVAVTDSNAQYAPWYESRLAIRTVTFADALQPRSTATWFYGCNNLTEIRGLERLDTSKVTDMSQMFARCTALTTLDLTALDTSGVTNTRQMFNNCAALETLDLTGWNTANVTDMADMFNGCTALKTVCASDSFKKRHVYGFYVFRL